MSNTSNKFTPKAQYALNAALTYACDLGHSYIGSEHLLLGLISTPDCAASKILTARGASAEAVKSAVVGISGVGSPLLISPSDMTPRVRRIIEGSAYECAQSGRSYIGTEHLLLSLISDRDCVASRILDGLGVSAADVRSDLSSYIEATNTRSAARPGEAQKAKQSEKSALASFGRDLGEAARRGRIDPIIGRDKETERVIQILSRRQKNNPCLIGEPGVGKTAVVAPMT